MAPPSSSRTDAMRAMAAKYSTQFPGRPRQLETFSPRMSTDGDVVLVTGTTGSLGCYLLDALIASSEISRVYAFNRPSKHQTSLRERQSLALIERGIDVKILDSPKLVLLEGELMKPEWGLTRSIFLELRRSLTHIIHNAWPVDFVAQLEAFEPTVKGVRSLLDFALLSPLSSAPRVLFTSTTAVLQRSSRTRSILEGPVDPEVVLHNGYSEAKWVCEQVMYAAAQQTFLDPLVIRVGQLVGGKDGAWAANEWFPAMVQGITHLQAFPDDDKDIDWITFEIAAAAVLDFRKAPKAIHTVHLVHPRHVSWHSVAVIIASELNVRLIPFVDWLAKLEQAAEALPSSPEQRKSRMREFRALQLIPFYRDLATNSLLGKMAIGYPEPDIQQALQVSKTLSNPALSQVNADDVRRWLAYWRRVGLLSASPMSRL